MSAGEGSGAGITTLAAATVNTTASTNATGSNSAEEVHQARTGPMQTADGRPITEVAVGVLLQADGRFLLAQRPAGKPYEGYWEFPGGKLERGESVEAALARELHEELGIQINGSASWRVIEHDYPHAYVRLFFHKITAWEGELIGREGQAFLWQQCSAVNVAPLLPAALPIIAWLVEEQAA